MELVFARTGVFGNTGWSMFFEAEPYTNPDLFAFTWFNGFREMGEYGGVLMIMAATRNGSGTHDLFERFYDVTTSDDKIQTIVHELAHFVGPASNANERVTDYAYGDVTNASMTALTSFKRFITPSATAISPLRRILDASRCTKPDARFREPIAFFWRIKRPGSLLAAGFAYKCFPHYALMRDRPIITISNS